MEQENRCFLHDQTVQMSTHRGLCLVTRLYPVERIVVGAVGEAVQSGEHLDLTEPPPAVAGQTGLGTVVAWEQGNQRIF